MHVMVSEKKKRKKRKRQRKHNDYINKDNDLSRVGNLILVSILSYCKQCCDVPGKYF